MAVRCCRVSDILTFDPIEMFGAETIVENYSIRIILQEGSLVDRRIITAAKITQFLARGPAIGSVLLTWALTYLVGIIIWAILFLFDLSSDTLVGSSPDLMKRDLATRLFVGSVVAPLVETFVFQWLPIRLICRVFKTSASLAVCVSTLMFGATHGYSVLYVAIALWGGFIFATVFVLRDHSGGHPFLIVAGAHAARNTLASILI
ncbi:hypothetical protein ACVK00_005394 [Burkholderia sp. PvR073]|uniref:CPBP family glutamic-type intramembrane protease n=1 Tax=Burkholderia TaxID=32008 RepID=UPI00254FA1A0|nr:CPBP family glutamic-type intramembrane protease [Burkholderia sp. lyk4-R2A-23]